jgi:hypothetical protein
VGENEKKGSGGKAVNGGDEGADEAGDTHESLAIGIRRMRRKVDRVRAQPQETPFPRQHVSGFFFRVAELEELKFRQVPWSGRSC